LTFESSDHNFAFDLLKIRHAALGPKQLCTSDLDGEQMICWITIIIAKCCY